jgi:hypothetical protein
VAVAVCVEYQREEGLVRVALIEAATTSGSAMPGRDRARHHLRVALVNEGKLIAMRQLLKLKVPTTPPRFKVTALIICSPPGM